MHEQLKDQYGFHGKLDFVFLMNRKNKVYVVSKHIGLLELDHLRKDSIGLYFCHVTPDSIRLSIEGSQIIGPLASKNVLDLEDSKLKDYVKGFDLERPDLEPGYYIVRHNAYQDGASVSSTENDSVNCSMAESLPDQMNESRHVRANEYMYDYMGTVNITQDRMLCFVSKSRRLKEVNM